MPVRRRGSALAALGRNSSPYGGHLMALRPRTFVGALFGPPSFESRMGLRVFCLPALRRGRRYDSRFCSALASHAASFEVRLP
jgi:hypothetical protein